MRAVRLQGEVNAGELFRRMRPPGRAVVQDVVLAENAGEVAPGEKDRAGTARAADARLLVKVQRSARNAGEFPRVAKAGMVRTLRAAAARAGGAAHQNTRRAHTKLRVQ